MNIFAVIGANFGDEGKGLVANYLCREAFLKNQKVLNVLTNGGCQRGHTAYNNKGMRHVYQHFGSGYTYADIYFSKYYMLNPISFIDEYIVLKDDKMNDIYVDENCTLSTPFDMLINRMVEDRRTNRHGSCGYGIWETYCRNFIMPIYWKDLIDKSRQEIIEILKTVRNTYFTQLIELYQLELTDDEKNIFYSDNLIDVFTTDILAMQKKTNLTTFDKLVENYDTVVFENAQGLLLDMKVNKKGTPSRTGMTYIRDIVGDRKVIPYYVTRTYLTKHGNGHFDGECKKKDINQDMIDFTNHPNDYQGTLRYGLFNEERVKELLNRIQKDAQGEYKVVVTHMNEYQCPYINFADFVSYDEINVKEVENVI